MPSDVSSSSLEKELADVNRQMYERNVELSIRNRTLSVLRTMYEIINTTVGLENTADHLIDAIIQALNFQKGCIALYDKHTRSLHSIAVATSSQLKKQKNVKNYDLYRKFKVPLANKNNYAVLSVLERKPHVSNSLIDIVTPLYTEEEAQNLEKALNIQTTVVYPIIFAKKVLGVLILSLDKHIGYLSRAEFETLRELVEVLAIAIERAQMYVALKEANQQLKELDHLKDEFVSVASHELRTPMTAIKSYLWMAINGKGGEISEKNKYYLDRAYSSADRLIKLVNDMLNVSRIEANRVALEVQQVDIQQLAQETIFEVKPRADELGLKIVLKKDNSVPKVIADVDKIKEVLINFIGNSLKFTPTGGKITVSFEKKDDMVITHVSDTGKGISQEDQTKLFQKFGLLKDSYTTNQIAQGTGLGLYICKSIIEMHKGKIWAFSEGKDKGSVFSFSLKVFNPSEMKKIQSEQEGKEVKEIIHTGL